MVGGVGATWFKWQERYIGLTLEYGDINYTQVGVTDFLVDKRADELKAASEYVKPDSELAAESGSGLLKSGNSAQSN